MIKQFFKNILAPLRAGTRISDPVPRDESRPETSGACDIEYMNRGSQFFKDEKLDCAEQCYRQAIAANPDLVEAYNGLGLVLKQKGIFDQAADCFQKSFCLKPGYAEAHYNLGDMLDDHGRFNEAVACYQKALALEPDYVKAHNSLGVTRYTQGKLDEAISGYRRAIALDPGFAKAFNNLGVALHDTGKQDEAIACYQKALALDPGFADAHNNLGNVFKTQGRMDHAVTCYRKTLELKPGHAKAYNNLGSALADQGKPNEAIAYFKKALELKPDFVEAHSNLIFTLDLTGGVDTTALQEERKKWDAAHAVHLLQYRAHANLFDPERRLRIGYVSADLRAHSASIVFGAMLVKFDASRFEVFAYSNSIKEDAHTRLLQKSVTCWKEIVGMSDDEVAKLVREDEIDILVDLSGHSAGNRLLVFARKPSPVQITAWGYIGGTGMGAMDVFFADPVIVPPGEKPLYREEVRYLPNVVGASFPQTFPAINALPALSADGITFGSFNRMVKISDESCHAWAEILLSVPRSRLILKTAELDDVSVRERVIGFFTKAGVEADRIIMRGKTSWHEHMQAYNQVDLALDPFPHGGGVTTLEGLMMGVPVVTLRWPTVVGRLSASILTTLELTGWIAETREQYVGLAIQKAGDLQSLALLRQQLRGIFTSSVIGDQAAYARAVEHEYRQLWQERCGRQAGFS